MAPTLHIHLLGEFRLFMNDEPLTTLNKPRQQALLAYLLLHRHAPHSRQQIAFTFWPDSSEGQAYTNLRKIVFQLRQALPNLDSFISTDTQSLGWREDAPFSLDVADLEQTLAELEQASTPDVATVQQVVALYQGELLPTCYDDWLLPLRRALHERVVNTLTQALVGLETQQEYEVGLRTAEHLRRLDPLHEAAYRHLMHLRALSRDRTGALRIYHECVTMLDQEFGVSPATETQALYQQLLKGEAQGFPIVAPARVQRHEHIPLVGRKQEWQVLQQAWHQMTSRGPHMVTVWGEAGVGKTRLVEELMHWARLRAGTVAYARSYAVEGDLGYAPVTSWLRSEGMRKRLNALDAVWLIEITRLLPELLIEIPTLMLPAPMTEGWQRQRFHEALARAVLAAPAPRLLILDDVQWCDAETLAWLRHLLRFDPHAALLVVGTARSEAVDEQHPLRDLLHQLQRESQFTSLELTPLSVEETAVLAGHLTDDDVTGWATQLYQETEGNPLFVVETVRAGLIDKLGEPGKVGRLPATLQAVITSRLTQLSLPTSQLAQLAATIGRLFTVDVLVEASDIGEEALVQALDELWRRRIVREQPNGYDFSHDKIREVIYREMSPMRRRLLHGHVAQALERLYADHLHDVAGELAAHYEQAGNIQQALTYIQRAAVLAHRLYAHTEAIKYLRHGLALVGNLPAADQNTKFRLELLTYLSFILMETEGTASAKVMSVYEQGRLLNRKMTATPDSFALLHAMTTSFRVRADFATTLELGTRLLNLAQQSQNPQHLVTAHFQLGAMYFTTGELGQARAHLELSAGLCAIQQAHARPHSWLGEVLLLLGYPDQALVKYRDALEPLRSGAAPYDVIATLGDTLELRLVAGVHEAVDEDIELFLETAHRYQFTQHETWSRFLQGWSLAKSTGLPMVERMESGVRDFQEIGGGARLSRYLGLVAEQYFEHGELAKAEAFWEEAMSCMEQHSERFWEAELYRLKGEIMLARGSHMVAESWLQRAVDSARGQQAKLLELRATMSLSRLWQQQGKYQQAYVLLAEIYGWFSEGFDAPDIKSAKALLATLT